jgi:hypothetical protein
MPPTKKPGKSKDPDVRLWATHAEESVYFQREAQVNFWTVLGGLAMAALLTQLSPLLKEMQASRWYLLLYFVASVLILANSWVQTAWGSLAMKWPISIASTVIVLFQMLAEAIQCLLVTNGGILLCALTLQVWFAVSGAWKVFLPATIKRFKFLIGVYIFFLFLCLAAALELYLVPSRIAELVWGFVVIALSVVALYMQHKGMQGEKKELGIP